MLISFLMIIDILCIYLFVDKCGCAAQIVFPVSCQALSKTTTTTIILMHNNIQIRSKNKNTFNKNLFK